MQAANSELLSSLECGERARLGSVGAPFGCSGGDAMDGDGMSLDGRHKVGGLLVALIHCGTHLI